jgi:hypothetical protein
MEKLLIAVALFPLTWLLSPGEMPADVRAMGAVLWCLCLIPAARYAFGNREMQPPFPFLPLIGLVYGGYYAFAAMAGKANLNYVPMQVGVPYVDPQTEFSTPVRLALVGWCALLLGYATLNAFRRPVVRNDPPWPARQLVPLLLALAYLGIAVQLAQDILPLPSVINGSIYFLTVICRFALAVLVALRARGYLTPRERAALWTSVSLIVVLWVTGGSIGKIFLFLIYLILAHSMGGGRVPLRAVILGVVGILTVTTIKGVLGDYRRRVWFGEAQMNVVQRAGLMFLLTRKQVDELGVGGAVAHGLTTSAARSATLDVFADVVRRTPRDIPYLDGSTYLSLVGAFVPRVLWPSKPTKNLGQMFGHRYQYLLDSDVSTSVNLPFLVEFYMNFGEFGVVFGMFVVGLIYAGLERLLNRRGQTIVRTLMGMAILIPMLDLESDFSLTFGGVVLHLVAFTLLLRYLRRRVDRAAALASSSNPVTAGFAALGARKPSF